MSAGAPADSNAGQARFHMFTDEQQQLRKEIREFAAREIAPNVIRWDEAERVSRGGGERAGPHGAAGRDFPAAIRRRGTGLCGICAGDRGVVARGWQSIGIIVAAHNSLCTNHIFLAGTEAQRKKYLPKLASGEWLGAWGLTEPGRVRMPAARGRRR